MSQDSPYQWSLNVFLNFSRRITPLKEIHPLTNIILLIYSQNAAFLLLLPNSTWKLPLRALTGLNGPDQPHLDHSTHTCP